MMAALNDLHYDIWTTGNHEYDFGMDTLKKIIQSFQGHAVLSNVFDAKGKRIAEPYVILERNGIRIAVLCMVTPCIALWYREELAGFTVTHPKEETERLLEELKGKYDLLIGVHHMGMEDENGIFGSGIRNYIGDFPEYDAIVASHEHRCVKEWIHGIPVVENLWSGKSIARIDFVMEETEDGWKIKEKNAEVLLTEGVMEDPSLSLKYRFYREDILRNTSRIIGTLEGEEPMAMENEILPLPRAVLEPSALITLFHRVMCHYSGAKVSAIALCKKTVNLRPGPIAVSDVMRLYAFANDLVKVRMSGRQLKKYMEWSASFFRTMEEDDLTVSFVHQDRVFDYDMFSGIHYEIDISKPPGERIGNLFWPDHTPFQEEEWTEVALTSFRYASMMKEYGPLFQEEDGLPELLDKDVRSDIGGIQKMIMTYIEQEMHGRIRAEKEGNWRIIGIHRDESQYRRAIRLFQEGILDLSLLDNGNRPLKVKDLEGL